MYIYFVIKYLESMLEQSKLKHIFSEVQDYRSDINKLHNLIDSLLIGIISVICGAETWKQMVEFVKSKKTFFEKILRITSWYTFRRYYQ